MIAGAKFCLEKLLFIMQLSGKKDFISFDKKMTGSCMKSCKEVTSVSKKFTVANNGMEN